MLKNDDYKLGKCIKKSEYLDVYIGTYKEKKVIIKKINSKMQRHFKAKKQLNDEISILKKINLLLPKNAPKYLDSNEIVLIEEIVGDINLDDYFKNEKNLTKKLRILLNTCNIVCELLNKSKGIISNCDIKPSNFRYSKENNKVYIIDFDNYNTKGFEEKYTDSFTSFERIKGVPISSENLKKTEVQNLAMMLFLVINDDYPHYLLKNDKTDWEYSRLITDEMKKLDLYNNLSVLYDKSMISDIKLRIDINEFYRQLKDIINKYK